jgi:SGNH domain (fused to AT3 domains)
VAVTAAAAQVATSQAFYGFGARAWELLAGCAVGAWLTFHPPIRSQRAREYIALTGLTLIVLALMAADRERPLTALPVIGGALVILAPDTVVARLLSLRPAVFVGLISYSAYLWHVPVLAFAREAWPQTLPSPAIAGLVGATLILAVLTWRYVEAPFRERRRYTRRAVFAAAAAGSLSFALAGQALQWDDGLMSRYSPQRQMLLRTMTADYRTALQVHGLGQCFVDYHEGAKQLLERNCVAPSTRPRVIVFGDSEAAHLVAGLRATQDRFEVQQWTAASCRAVRLTSLNDRCSQVVETFLTQILPTLTAQDVLVVGSAWISTFAKHDPFEARAQVGIAALTKGRARVVLVTSTPEFDKSPSETLLRGDDLSGPARITSQDFRPSRAALERIGARLGIVVYDPTADLCDGLDCLVFDGRELLYIDSGHLSAAGSVRVMRRLADLL